MFRKKEDDLIKFAFGEMDSHDMQVFEANLLNDPSLTKEADVYREMREDLASFRDVPEMQFSVERLRSAILDQGIQPKRDRAPWLTWLLAPTAVASVLALGFVLTNGVNRKTQIVMAEPTVAMKSEQKSYFESKPDPSDFQVTQMKEQTVFTPSPSRSDEVLQRSRSRIVNNDASSPARSRTRVRLANTPRRSKTAIIVASNAVSPLSSESTSPSVSNPVMDTDAMTVARMPQPKISTPSISEAPLVLIDSSQDSGVGAAVATEVTNPTNVIIGG
jgi:hypothetical protein